MRRFRSWAIGIITAYCINLFSPATIKAEEIPLKQEYPQKITEYFESKLNNYSIYVNRHGNEIKFTDKFGFNHEISDSAGEEYEEKYGTPMLNCYVLDNENFKDWEYFLGDLVLDAGWEVLESRLKKNKLYSSVIGEIERRTKLGISFTDDEVIAYQPFTNNAEEKYEEYVKKEKKSKLSLDARLEVDRLDLQLFLRLGFNPNEKIESSLKAYPFEDLITFSLRDKIKNSRWDWNVSSSYDYEKDLFDHGLTIGYSMNENAKLKTMVSYDSEGDGYVFFKFCYSD